MSSPSEQSYLAMADYIRDFNVKMIDIGRANAEAVSEFAHQIAIAEARPISLIVDDERQARAPSRLLAASNRPSRTLLDGSVGARRTHFARI